MRLILKMCRTCQIALVSVSQHTTHKLLYLLKYMSRHVDSKPVCVQGCVHWAVARFVEEKTKSLTHFQRATARDREAEGDAADTAGAGMGGADICSGGLQVRRAQHSIANDTNVLIASATELHVCRSQFQPTSASMRILFVNHMRMCPH